MKTKIQYGMLTAVSVVLLTAVASAQQSATPAAKEIAAANHVSIPLSHPGQPATLKVLQVSLMRGSVTIKGSTSAREIVVDTTGSKAGATRPDDGNVVGIAYGVDSYMTGTIVSRGQKPSDGQAQAESQGMHRLNPNPDWSAEEDNNVVTISSSGFLGGTSDMTIEVPVNTALDVRTTNVRLLDVENVDADISLVDVNGSITLKDVGGSIVASANNGRITGNLTHLSSTKPSSLTSNNSTIDVTLPADAKATLTLRSDRGSIWMDDNFKFETIATTAATGGREDSGLYRVEVNRTIKGNLNGGGPEISLRTINGSIYVRRAK